MEKFLRLNFLSPVHLGKLKNPQYIFSSKSEICDDNARLYFNIEKNKITEFSYLMFGCPYFCSACSIMSIYALNHTLDEILSISDKEILELMQEVVPEEKERCVILPFKILKEAVLNVKHNS